MIWPIHVRCRCKTLTFAISSSDKLCPRRLSGVAKLEELVWVNVSCKFQLGLHVIFLPHLQSNIAISCSVFTYQFSLSADITQPGWAGISFAWDGT